MRAPRPMRRGSLLTARGWFWIGYVVFFFGAGWFAFQAFGALS